MALVSCMLTFLFIYTGMAVRDVIPPCDPHVFDSSVEVCLSDFNRSLETSGLQDHCAWPGAKRIYTELKLCVENSARVSQCWGRGSLMDEVFLKVHEMYFSNCGLIQDPPLFTLVMLAAPVTIVTLLMPLLCVYLTPRDVSVI